MLASIGPTTPGVGDGEPPWVMFVHSFFCLVQGGMACLGGKVTVLAGVVGGNATLRVDFLHGIRVDDGR